nr:MAG TPA_asm: hypothetical protein [Caudoviricetes sp.]
MLNNLTSMMLRIKSARVALKEENHRLLFRNKA